MKNFVKYSVYDNIETFATNCSAVLKDENYENTKTCKSCKHRQRWQCNSKVIQYCGKRKSNRTNNGLLKIKCKDKACLLHESE